jgi:hypothetical protein
MSHFIVMTAKVQRLFEFPFDLRERAAHAIERDLGTAVAFHHSTALSTYRP